MIPDSIQEYPLTKRSLIFIAGGWNGVHTRYYLDNYGSRIHVFEPQVGMVEYLKEQFQNLPNVHIHDFGLGVESGDFPLSRVGTDACSFLALRPMGIEGENVFEGPHETGRLVELGAFLQANRIKVIDLALLNMEGYEFRLLPWLVETGTVKNFRYLMVQFHPQYEGHLPGIRDMMAATHDIRDDYEPQWIVWQRRSDE